MLSVRLHPGGELRLEQEAEPVPGAGEALVRIASVGLCGSDRHWLLEGGIGEARLEAPLVLGHEFAGLAETGRHRGRLVAGDPTINCLRCPPCTAGRSNLCVNQRFAGYGGSDGALRELISWPERLLYPLTGVEPAEAALVEPLAVGLHAVELAGELRGRSVAVVGCGPIGLLIVSLARRAGASEVLAAEPLAHRLAEAIERGAQVLPATAGESLELDVAFEVAGDDEAVDRAVELVRPGGRVVLVGIPRGERTSFAAAPARRKGLTLSLTRRSTEHSFKQAVELAQEGSLGLGRLVSHRLPLSQARRAFELLRQRDGLKVVVEGPAAA